MAYVNKAHPFIPQRGHTSLEVARTTRRTDTILAISSGDQSRPSCHPDLMERGWIP